MNFSPLSEQALEFLSLACCISLMVHSQSATFNSLSFSVTSLHVLCSSTGGPSWTVHVGEENKKTNVMWWREKRMTNTLWWREASDGSDVIWWHGAWFELSQDAQSEIYNSLPNKNKLIGDIQPARHRREFVLLFYVRAHPRWPTVCSSWLLFIYCRVFGRTLRPSTR